MDIRNVQRTGNMHYVYLPTSWCKQYNINSDSKVSVEMADHGSLTISPVLKERELQSIELTLDETDHKIIGMLIMACYINPTKSFKINLKKGTDIAKLLSQKGAISGFEFVEIEGDSITHESSMTINDPDALLKTMVKKIKNLSHIMITDYNKDLIQKYEEEVDRSKLLIDKAVASSLILNEPSKLKSIELHYTALISQHLERMVDNLIFVDKKEKTLIQQVSNVMGTIKELLDDIENLSHRNASELIKRVLAIKKPSVTNLTDYQIRRIRSTLLKAAEVFLDWAITKMVEKTK